MRSIPSDTVSSTSLSGSMPGRSAHHQRPVLPVLLHADQVLRLRLRHYYGSILLTDGASIAELASYLGHHVPAFTLRVYGHLQQGRADHVRSIIDRRMYRPRKVPGASLRLVEPDERPSGA
jgi:hypothetical protein